MELLHLTDTHLGLDRWFVGAAPGWRRADDHLLAMRLALAPALRGEVDLVVHSGDLFDRSRPPPRAVAEARALLAEVGARVPVLLFPGNHDRHGVARHFPEPIPGVRVVDTPTRLGVGGVELGLVPHFREARDWARAAAAMDGVDLLVCHQSFHGARVPGHVFRQGGHAETVGAHQLPRVGAILCGHLHPRQAIRLGEVEVVMPGSTERTSFSERDETKGYARWTLGDRPRWRFVDLPSRAMRVVAGPGDLDDLAPGTLVHVTGEDPEELHAQAARRGAWLTPRRSPTPQVALFPLAAPPLGPADRPGPAGPRRRAPPA